MLTTFCGGRPREPSCLIHYRLCTLHRTLILEQWVLCELGSGKHGSPLQSVRMGLLQVPGGAVLSEEPGQMLHPVDGKDAVAA